MARFGRDRVFIAAAVLTLFALAAGCQSGPIGTDGGPDGGLQQVRGHVVEVVARSITEVETLRVRGEDGREYVFATEGFIGFTPAHLREHSLFGQTVLVTYREDGGRLVAVRTED